MTRRYGMSPRMAIARWRAEERIAAAARRAGLIGRDGEARRQGDGTWALLDRRGWVTLDGMPRTTAEALRAVADTAALDAGVRS